MVSLIVVGLTGFKNAYLHVYVIGVCWLPVHNKVVIFRCHIRLILGPERHGLRSRYM